MGDRKAYFREYKRIEREIDRQLGRRYRADEPMPGESYSDFKRRFKAVDTRPKNKYPAWERAPDEPIDQFRKRMTSKKLKGF